MIKIALKHFIYEKCISILFDFINRNFNTPKLKKFTIDMFHEGDRYDYMEVDMQNNGLISFLYECRIIKLLPTHGLIEIAHKSGWPSLRPEQIIRTCKRISSK